MDYYITVLELVASIFRLRDFPSLLAYYGQVIQKLLAQLQIQIINKQ